MNGSYAKPEWFGNNQEAIDIYNMFVDLAHTWDDLVDKDKDVTEDQINHAFMVCLVHLPSNNVYRQLQHIFIPMWSMVISAYKVANKFERNKDEHGVEIAHGLRYAAGHMISQLVTYCVGPQKADEVMPEIWKDIFAERWDEYRKEHLNAS